MHSLLQPVLRVRIVHMRKINFDGSNGAECLCHDHRSNPTRFQSQTSGDQLVRICVATIFCGAFDLARVEVNINSMEFYHILEDTSIVSAAACIGENLVLCKIFLYFICCDLRKAIWVDIIFGFYIIHC